MKLKYQKPLSRAVHTIDNAALMSVSKETGILEPEDGRSKRTEFDDEDDDNGPFPLKIRGNYNAWNDELGE